MFEHLLKPLAAYMAANQEIGALIAGIIACLESMAIVGSIIPGSVTMTIIGTMIGSGVLDMQVTFTYIIVGAFIGDYLSYWVGNYYRDSIKKFNIIKKNMEWMDYGENFIKKYGVMSIIIGRFFGPMRSIIPLVAGVLGMTKFNFILGALPSVVLWAVVYLAPGVLLGAFSLEMPAELALKFIAAIVAVIVVVVFISWLIKKILSYLHKNQNIFANFVWEKLMENPGWMTKNFFHCDKNGPVQVLKFIYAIGLLFGCMALMLIIVSNTSINIYDLDIFHLMRNTYVKFNYEVFTLVTFLGDKFVLIPTVVITSLYLAYKKEYRLTKYVLGVTGITSILVEMIKYFVMRPRPILSSTFTEPYSFPSGHVALSAAVFGFFALVLCHHLSKYKRSLVYKVVGVIVALISFSRLYLCAHWLSDVIFALFMGSIIALVASILYHRKPCKINIKYITIILFGSFTFFYIIFAYINYNNYINSYDPPYLHERSIPLSKWWGNARENDIFRDNKFGNPVYPLNIQWLGEKNKIEEFLTKSNWQRHQPQKTVISRVFHLIDEPSIHIMPILPQTYQQRTAEIIYSKNTGETQVVLKLWRSFLNIMPNRTPIWLGSIYKNTLPEKLFSMPIRYNPKTLNTTSLLAAYDKDLEIITTDLSRDIQFENNLPSNIKRSGWDGKIVQIRFKNKEEMKNDKK